MALGPPTRGEAILIDCQNHVIEEISCRIREPKTRRSCLPNRTKLEGLIGKLRDELSGIGTSSFSSVDK